MAKSQPGKVVKAEPAKPKAGVCKSLASPNSKKATTDGKKFIDDLFSKPAKPSVPASEKLNSSKQAKPSEPAAKVCCHTWLLMDSVVYLGQESLVFSREPGLCVQTVKGSAGGRDDLFGLQEAERKQTEEGWKVYTEEELMMNKKGGNTDLCPFDCECCY